MMQKTPFRIRLCISLLCCNLLFIWGNSLLPGHISGAISDCVRDLLAALFPGDSPGTGGGLLRKLAHFSEFAALGACLGWLFGMLERTRCRQLLPALGAGLLAACLDETIQRFVPGRSSQLTDVLIDFSGVVTGLVLLTVIRYFIKNNHTKLEDSL